MTELEFLESKLRDTEKQIAEETAKEELRKTAEGLFAIFQSLKDAGFDDEKAWWIFGTMFQEKFRG